MNSVGNFFNYENLTIFNIINGDTHSSNFSKNSKCWQENINIESLWPFKYVIIIYGQGDVLKGLSGVKLNL